MKVLLLKNIYRKYVIVKMSLKKKKYVKKKVNLKFIRPTTPSIITTTVTSKPMKKGYM